MQSSEHYILFDLLPSVVADSSKYEVYGTVIGLDELASCFSKPSVGMWSGLRPYISSLRFSLRGDDGGLFGGSVGVFPWSRTQPKCCEPRSNLIAMIFRVSAAARARAGVVGRRLSSSEVAKTSSTASLNAFASGWYNLYVPIRSRSFPSAEALCDLTISYHLFLNQVWFKYGPICHLYGCRCYFGRACHKLTDRYALGGKQPWAHVPAS